MESPLKVVFSGASQTVTKKLDELCDQVIEMLSFAKKG